MNETIKAEIENAETTQIRPPKIEQNLQDRNQYPMPIDCETEEKELENLTLEEYGMRVKLMIHYWRYNGQVLADEMDIASMCDIHIRLLRRLWHVVEDTFTVEGRLLKHDYLDQKLYELYANTEEEPFIGEEEEENSGNYRPGVDCL